MKPLSAVLGLSLLLSGAALAEDMKCYAELARPLGEKFQSKEGQQQDASQLR